MSLRNSTNTSLSGTPIQGVHNGHSLEAQNDSFVNPFKKKSGTEVVSLTSDMTGLVIKAKDCNKGVVAAPTPARKMDDSEARSIINNWMNLHGIDNYPWGTTLLTLLKKDSPKSRLKKALSDVKAAGNAVVTMLTPEILNSNNHIGLIRYSKKQTPQHGGFMLPRCYTMIIESFSLKKNLDLQGHNLFYMTEHAMIRLLQRERPSSLFEMNKLIAPYLQMFAYYYFDERLPYGKFILIGEEGYFVFEAIQRQGDTGHVMLAKTWVSSKSWSKAQREHYDTIPRFNSLNIACVTDALQYHGS